jgi:hypothetical protein
MIHVNVTLEITSYIAHPYWPAKNQCIEIEKKSGVNRQKSEEKRVSALKAECQHQGISYDRYLELREEARSEWYRRADGTIYIPRHQLAGMFVQMIAGSPKALRGPFDKDNFRALVQVGDFETDLKEPSGTFSRFVKLDGSNQRSFQENQYLGQYLDQGSSFTARGVITIADPKNEDTVRALLNESIQRVGLGAARKMGFGRGRVAEWKANGKK